MMDSDEPRSNGERPASEGDKEDSRDASLPIRADGGVIVSAGPSIHRGHNGTVEPIAPTIENSTDQDTETGRASYGSSKTDPADRSEPNDRISLAPFEELCGRLIGVRQTEGKLVIQLSAGTLELPLNSTEAAICLDELDGNTWNRVSILRTSDPGKPLLVDCVGSSEVS